MNKKYLINIVGPTAIGKTSLSIELAQRFNTEIISADSRQFYKEMSVGTAVPSPEELAAAPHHFIQHKSIKEDFSVGDFEKEALGKLEELFRKNPIVIMVGGSGLYTRSVTEGLDHFPGVDPSIREKLNETATTNGLLALQLKLQKLDPEYYAVADIENPHRIIRALEICIGTGKAYSTFLKRDKVPRNFSTISIGLSAERQEIYDRINRRVDHMMDEGLLDEAERLYAQRHLNALNTVGYKELFAFLDNKTDLETAVEEIKKNTRRFAKRQLTWFRKDKNLKWFDYRTPAEEIEAFIQKHLELKF